MTSPMIPREVWEKILRYLDLRDLISVSATCRFFRVVANEPRLWCRIDFGQEWMRFLRFSSEFVHLRQPQLKCLRLSRSPGFEIENDSESSADPLLLLRSFSFSHLSSLTELDFSGAFREHIVCYPDEMDRASKALAQALEPLNDRLRRLSMPADARFVRVLSGVAEIRNPVFPRLERLSGAFLPEDIELISRLESLLGLALLGHAWRGKIQVTVYRLTKAEPRFFAPLQNCDKLGSLELKTFGMDMTSLFFNDSQPSLLADNLIHLTVTNMELDEPTLAMVFRHLRNLESFVVHRLVLFNPRHPALFAGLSRRLRRFQVSLPCGDDFLPDDLERRLFKNLDRREELEEIRFSNFSLSSKSLYDFHTITTRFTEVTIRSKTPSDFGPCVSFCQEAKNLERATIVFPEDEVGGEDEYFNTGVYDRPNHFYRFYFRRLRVRGRVPAKVVAFFLQIPRLLECLEICPIAAASAIEYDMYSANRTFEFLRELTVRVDTREQEKSLGVVLAETKSLVALDVTVNSGGELLAERAMDAVFRGVNPLAVDLPIRGDETWELVIDFASTSPFLERLRVFFATPFGHSSMDGSLDRLDKIRTKIRDLETSWRLKDIVVKVAKKNNRPPAVFQKTKDSFGSWKGNVWKPLF